MAQRLAGHREHQIDSTQEMLSSTPSDRTYQISITVWDAEENQDTLIYEVDVGPVDGALAVVYWIPL